MLSASFLQASGIVPSFRALRMALVVSLSFVFGLLVLPYCSRVPSFQGAAATTYLKQEGLYNSLAKSVEAAQYTVRPVEAALRQAGAPQYAAHNPAQSLCASFTSAGLELQGISDARGSWRTAWRLRSIGYGRRQTEVGPAELVAEGTRIDLRHEGGVTEWYINGAAGLEQGFMLSRPPGQRRAGERLRLTLAVEGDLRARAEGDQLELARADGTALLRYSHLEVSDGRGHKLPAEMGVSADGSEQSVWMELDDTAAVWPVTIDPTFTQQAYLKASNIDAGDFFGWSVAISGNTAVVGAPRESSNGSSQSDNSLFESGAAYIFVRSGGAWIQQAYLKASNADASDNFGWSVGISSDTVVVGAPLESGNGSSQSDNSLLESGAAYVFVRSAGVWIQQAYLKASNLGAFDEFGASVGISGDTVVVGGLHEAAYVFVRSGGAWIQQAYLKASNPDVGDFFGSSVAISGDTVVVGAPLESGNGSSQSDNSLDFSGAVYVFVRTGAAWTQQAYLKASNLDAHDGFGASVGISGDTVVVGAPGESSNGSSQSDNSLSASGAAYVFVRSGSSWSQQAYLKASNAGTGDQFGGSITISGDTTVVGASLEAGNGGSQNDNSLVNAGAAYVFVRSGGAWGQQSYLKASNPGAFDVFGASVGVSGDTVVVGAFGEASNGNSQSDNSVQGAGAAYVFVPNTPPTITPSPVIRQQGTSASAQIAVVHDAEDLAGTLAVTVQSVNPSNGVTISSILNNAGNVTASVAASCAASNASFTLRVTDSAGAYAEGTLNVTVTPTAPAVSASVGTSSLWPPNGDLVNIGLMASTTGNCAPTMSVKVYSNEDDQTPESGNSPDAKNIAPGTLRLRSERTGSGDGRVYLIIVQATDSGGHTAYAAATVVVPHGQDDASIQAVNAAAASAKSYALSHGGTAPPGYSVVGDGPVIGPKQ
jgi:hypothetical protein